MTEALASGSQLAEYSDKDAKELQDRFREDPIFYVKEYLGVTHWWDGMERMLNALPRAIREGKPVVVGSGHALSKDFTVSGCVPLWFVHAYGPSAIVAMTAPSDRQVKKVMWGELSRRYNNRLIKDEFGRLLSCELRIADNWYVLAFTTKETGGMVGKFQGFHANAVCVITSEAQAIDDTIYEEIEGIMTSPVSLQIHLGNPLHTTGRYAAMLRDTTNNIVINLSCLDSPNYKARKEVVPGMVTYDWVEAKRKLWGEEDPRWVSRVLGKVPSSSVNTVISEELWEKSLNKELYPSTKRGVIGVDPGRFGDDDMVITVMESGELLERIVLPKCTAVEGAGQIVMAQKKHFPHGQIAIVIDCDGLGGPYMDIAKSMIPDDMSIMWIAFHGSSSDREKIGDEFQNLRAEASFYARDQMMEGVVKVDDDQYLREEATATEYFINLKGRIQIEDKDDLKERLGRSPDRWDSMMMAIWGFKYAPVIKPKDAWRDDDSRSMLMAGGTAMGA